MSAAAAVTSVTDRGPVIHRSSPTRRAGETWTGGSSTTAVSGSHPTCTRPPGRNTITVSGRNRGKDITTAMPPLNHRDVGTDAC